MLEQARRLEQLLDAASYAAAWRHCCRLCSCRADAEDLLQESLLTALQACDRLRDASAFKAWLVSIVHRNFLNKLRWRQRDARQVEALAQFQPHSSAGPEAGDVADVLAALPLQQRILLTLFYLEGFSGKETAQVLGISPLALQSRLNRAREAFRRLFQRLAAPVEQRSNCHAEIG